MMNDKDNTNNKDIDIDIVNDLQDAIIEVFQVLRSHGIEEMHMGGLLRLLGADEKLAKEYDEHIMLAEALEAQSEFDLTEIPESSIVSNSGTKLH